MSVSSCSMVAQHKLLAGNLQGGFHTAFAKRLFPSNHTAMGELIDMQRIRDLIRDAMVKKGYKPTSLSLAVGDNRTLVKSILERNGDIKIGTLSKIASVLDVSLDTLLAAPRVPIVGYIGAGGTIVFEEFHSDDSAPRPPAISGDLEALIVRGDSMLPKYKDGDIIYIQKQCDGLVEDYLGEDCAVRLVTGETYIKQLMRGSEQGRFTLFSLNAPPMENLEVEWATPVAFILPARSRQLFS